MSDDVSALLEIASSPDPSPSPAPEPEPIETDITLENDASEVIEETGDGASTPEAPPPDDDPKPDARKIIGEARKALKAFRDSSPENAPLARQLNDIVGRYDGYKSVFPKVADAQAAKAMIDAVGGNDGLATLQSTIKSVNETDALLFNGDPKVLDNLLDDMRREGKVDAFGKLAGPFLDKLRGLDEKAYYNAFNPHFHQNLVASGFPDVVGNLLEYLSAATPDIESAKKTLGSMKNWFDTLSSKVDSGAKANLDPDRAAFEQERTKFQTERQQAFQSEVHTDWNRENSRVLGTALKDYLKLPFAKTWTMETKQDLAQGVLSRLLSELTNDKSYQSQMDAFWSEKSPDKKRIVDYHRSQIEMRGKRIVKSVLEARYPGFSKSKVGIAPKPVTGAVKPAVATQPGVAKPMFVSSKPAEAEIDWARDPNMHLFITGKAYLKNGRLVTWNAKNK